MPRSKKAGSTNNLERTQWQATMLIPLGIRTTAIKAARQILRRLSERVFWAFSRPHLHRQDEWRDAPFVRSLLEEIAGYQ